LADVATDSNRKQLAETLKQRAHKLAKVKDEAEKMAEGLTGKTLKIGAKVGENGKIFGSVNTIMLADAIKALGFEVDRKNIKIKGDTIKSVGKYEAEVVLHRDVVRTIAFEVVEE
jgi:large subunit ribosomal protein L9